MIAPPSDEDPPRTALGKVSKVELLGSDVALRCADGQGLTVTPGDELQPLPGNHQSIAGLGVPISAHHTRQGLVQRRRSDRLSLRDGCAAAISRGDFNNDLTTSDTPGDVGLFVHRQQRFGDPRRRSRAPGMIEIQIDGQTCATWICPQPARARRSRRCVK